MRHEKISLILICLILIIVFFISTTSYSGMAYLCGQQKSGFYKICYYRYLGNTIAITIKAYKPCPIFIRVD